MSTSTIAPLQPELDAITTGSAAMLASMLTPAELETLAAQFLDPVNPYPVPAVGTVAPDFTLTDNNGKQVTLSQVVQSGKNAILTWYRGEWCPYCSATLKAHNARVADYAQLNAQLYAITPTLPTLTPATVAKFGLTYTILSDVGNAVAKQYGSVNQINEDLSAVHTRIGVNWHETYGDDTHLLPHPGTFIVEARTRKIVFARVELDFRKRVEPAELLDELRKIQ